MDTGLLARTLPSGTKEHANIHGRDAQCAPLLKSKSMLLLVLDVKAEFDNVAVLDRVFLAFEAELASFAGFGFGAAGHEVVE